MDGEPNGIAVAKIGEIDVVAVETDLGFIDGEVCSQWEFGYGVFERLVQQDQIGSAEAVIGIAWEQRLAVDVRAADGRVEVEGHGAMRVGNRASHEQPDADGAFMIDSAGDMCGRGARGWGSVCRSRGHFDRW